MSISTGLQYGIPVTEYTGKFKFMAFMPDGHSSDPDIRFASSVLDYVSKWIEAKHLKQSLHAGKPKQPSLRAVK
jgi:ribonucleoside-diphosphate reductase alpha chain